MTGAASRSARSEARATMATKSQCATVPSAPRLFDALTRCRPSRHPANFPRLRPFGHARARTPDEFSGWRPRGGGTQVQAMNTHEAKRVLETALICAQPPLPLRDMALFDDAVGPDTLRALLDELAQRLGRARRRTGGAGQRLAFPEPARAARVPRPAAPREAAALLARRDGDAGHHRLPAAGDARRHRRHPRRHRQRPDRQAARGPRLDRGHRLPRGAGPPGAVRDDAPVPRRPRPVQPRSVAAARDRQRTRRTRV